MVAGCERRHLSSGGNCQWVLLRGNLRRCGGGLTFAHGKVAEIPSSARPGAMPSLRSFWFLGAYLLFDSRRVCILLRPLLHASVRRSNTLAAFGELFVRYSRLLGPLCLYGPFLVSRPLYSAFFVGRFFWGVPFFLRRALAFSPSLNVLLWPYTLPNTSISRSIFICFRRCCRYFLHCMLSPGLGPAVLKNTGPADLLTLEIGIVNKVRCLRDIEPSYRAPCWR